MRQDQHPDAAGDEQFDHDSHYAGSIEHAAGDQQPEHDDYHARFIDHSARKQYFEHDDHHQAVSDAGQVAREPVGTAIRPSTSNANAAKVRSIARACLPKAPVRVAATRGCAAPARSPDFCAVG